MVLKKKDWKGGGGHLALFLKMTLIRSLCGLSSATSFSDLSDQMNSDQIDLLSSVYESVDDIDLYVGGLLEKHSQGSNLGHTFSCIITDQVSIHFSSCHCHSLFQMLRLKLGDRFFFSHQDSGSQFTEGKYRDSLKDSNKQQLNSINSYN